MMSHTEAVPLSAAVILSGILQKYIKGWKSDRNISVRK
jgi:hypothetical protein